MSEQTSPLALCADCGGRVSKKAHLCPHCGRPFGTVPRHDVTVRDVQMRFGSMVAMLVGFAFASIPALLILIAIAVFIFGAFGIALHR